jgi:hypothetical protein
MPAQVARETGETKQPVDEPVSVCVLPLPVAPYAITQQLPPPLATRSTNGSTSVSNTSAVSHEGAKAASKANVRVD